MLPASPSIRELCSNKGQKPKTRKREKGKPRREAHREFSSPPASEKLRNRKIHVIISTTKVISMAVDIVEILYLK